MILHLTTLKGQIYNDVKVRWEAVAYVDVASAGATRKGSFIYFIGGGAVWVCETGEEILSQVRSSGAPAELVQDETGEWS